MGGGAASAAEPAPLHHQLISLAGFVTFNIGLNEFNQWALKKDHWPAFHFPFFYTMFHMLVTALAAYLLQCCVVKPKLGPPSFRQLWDYKLAIVPMGVCSFLTNGLNNASLTLISLFLNQAIKACQPMPVMVFSFFLANKRYNWARIITVLMICVGSVLAVSYNLNKKHDGDQTAGIIMVLTGMLAASLKPVIAMLLMDGLMPDKPKLEPTVVMVYDSSIAFVCMLIAWLCMDERQESVAYLADPSTTAIGIVIVVVGSSMAFLFNLANFYFIASTSALTSSIAASGVKIILITVAAIQAAVRDPLSWTGVAVVVLSLSYYAYLSVPRAAPRSADPESGTAQPAASQISSTEKTPLVKP